MARFGPTHPNLPPAFFSDFTKMALDESKHLSVPFAVFFFFFHELHFNESYLQYPTDIPAGRHFSDDTLR